MLSLHWKTCYQKLAAFRAQMDRLKTLQANNSSTTAYGDELKQAVLSGVLSPATAGELMQEYAAMVTPATLLPATESTLPGTEDFARLEQRLRQHRQKRRLHRRAR